MLKQKLKLKIFLVAIIFGGIFGVAGKSFGATINAASCSYADVNSAVALANIGDTVMVPAGNCTWTNGLILSKAIHLQGMGQDETIITAGTNILITSSEDSTEISGFHFKAPSTTIIQIYGNGWRVHHSKFECTTSDAKVSAVNARGISSKYDPAGLVDNCEMLNAQVVVFGSAEMLDSGGTQSAIWAKPLNLGGSGAVYVEDCIFTFTAGGNIFDANYGGSYVARFNSLTSPDWGTVFEAHSVQGLNRSTRKWEIYGNSITGTEKYVSIWMRGGTGVIFNNKLSGTYSNQSIFLDNVRSFTDSSGSGLCSGDSLWDGNFDDMGWPCRDQIGRGPDATQWEYSPAGTYEQASVPAYIWGNKNVSGSSLSVSVINSPSENHIKLDRDYYFDNGSFDGASGTGCGMLSSRPATCTTGVGYWATNQSCSDLTGMVGANPANPISGTLYKCTASDTWTAYYTPYAYPHPLQESVDTIPPNIPSGLMVN